MVFNGDDDDGGDDALSSAYGSTSIASLMADPMIPPSHTSLSLSVCLFVCVASLRLLEFFFLVKVTAGP